MNTYFVDFKNGGSIYVCAENFKIGSYPSDLLFFKIDGRVVTSVNPDYVLQVLQLDDNDNYVKIF